MEEKQKKVERWSYPFKAKGSGTAASSEVTDPQIYYTALATAESGYYPVASNGLWHGGVHFDQNTGEYLDQSSVRCIADGVVIAYRIDDHYKKLTYTGSGSSKEVTYSTGFVLVRHRLELPPAPAATTPSTATPPAAEPELTFYSLYMHLMDWKSYQEPGAPTPPTFMCPIHYAVSEEDATNDFSGLFVRGGAPGTSEHGNKVAIIPKGCKVRVGDKSPIDDRWRKLVSILEGKASPALAPEIEHWVFPGQMTPTTDGDVFLVGDGANDVRASLLPGKGLAVRKEAKQHSAAMAVLPVDSQVQLEDGTGSYRKIKSIVASTLTSPLNPDCAPNIAGYIHFDSLKAVPPPPTLNTIHILPTPVPIQAGELIGHLGKYQAASQSEAHDLLHLEVFSCDDVEAFVAQSRARANQLKPEQKTLLKIPSSTKVITKEGASQANPPLISDPGQPTAYDMILPLAVLNALPADKKITLTTTASGTATTEQWWKLDKLPGEGDNPISGWVKEGELMTPRYHPWDWEGFDFIKETGTLDAMYACKLSADGVLDDGEKTNYQAQINTAVSGPIRKRLYSIIDLNNDEKLTSAEIKDALAKPWHAQSISRLIVQYESEWHADIGLSKWEALNCHMNKEGEKDWKIEKSRIETLLFWKIIGLDSTRPPFHAHPIGLLAFYGSKPELINTNKFLELYTALHPTFNNSPSLGHTSKENLREFIKNINLYYSEHNEKPNRYELAYMLATARHEMYHFPTGEYFSKKPEVGDYHYFDKYDPVLANTSQERQNAIDHENTLEGDGFKYRGRGPVHLTWKVNYRKSMEKFGPDFVNNPDLAAEFENSVPIMIWGIKTGIFTGKSIGDYMNATTVDYDGARKIINGVDQKALIASYARKFEEILKEASTAPTDF
jgi:hypothetical protein